MEDNPYISHEEEAPESELKEDPPLRDLVARAYIASLLNESHGEDFKKVESIKEIHNIIDAELANQINAKALWLELWGKIPNKQSERAQSLLKKARATESSLAKLITARSLLNRPEVLKLLKQIEDDSKTVAADELL